MKQGKLYGVGVGPGDKELITLKALRILQESDIIMVPMMKNGEKTAFHIIEDYVKDKEIIECNMPMSKDFDILQKNYEIISDEVEGYLKQGKDVAFITLGDPTVYSSYMQVNEIMGKRGYETEVIPGITSFCAAAARLIPAARINNNFLGSFIFSFCLHKSLRESISNVSSDYSASHDTLYNNAKYALLVAKLHYFLISSK